MKCCGTCRWWDIDFVRKAQGQGLNQHIAAACDFPMPAMPTPLPASFRAEKYSMSAREGADCLCWKERP